MSSSFAEIVAEYWEAHAYFLLYEENAILDLNGLQEPHCRVRGFSRWGALAFLWALFVTFICLLVFSKEVVLFVDALLQFLFFLELPFPN